MTKSKKSEELTPEKIEIIKAYKEQFERINGKSPKKTSKKYKAERGLIIRLKAAAMVLVASAGLIAAMTTKTEASYKQRNKYTLASVVAANEQEAPKIEKDGIEFELDGCSIAIVEGQIKEGENYAFAYDQNGNILEGNISSDNLRGAIELYEKDLQDYVIYQVTSEEGAQLIQTGEEVLDVSYGDFILGREQHQEYVDVLYPTEDDILRGKIDEKSLEVVNEVTVKKYQNQGAIKVVVNTAADGYARLNFRSSPNEEKYSIMMQIPNGTIIDSTGETIIENGRKWTRVKYEGETGWVATEYLKELTSKEETTKTEQPENDLITGIKNMSGGITGIDVSTMSPKQLRELMKDGIPKTVSTANSGSVNTSGVSGNINYVQMKIGASPYGNGEFKPIDCSAYEQLVAVCEEQKIPYGFYYYSTATNLEEAKIEADYIKQVIENLRSKYDMKYNVIPMTIDVELAVVNGKVKDRQYGKNIEDLTDAKAYVINRAQSDGVSEKVLLYTGGRIVDPESSDRLLDLGRLKGKLNNPEDFAIWLCAPITQNGNTTQRTEKYRDMIENKYGIEVACEQVALDVHAPSGGRVDINNMNINYFGKITKGIENDRTGEATVGEDEGR